MAEVDENLIIDALDEIKEILANTPPDRRFWGNHKEERIRTEYARLEFLYIDMKLEGLKRDLDIVSGMLGILKGDSGTTFELEF